MCAARACGSTFNFQLNKMKKLYIAGPISGREKEAEIEFRNAEEQLREAFPDAQIMNPFNFPHNHDKTWLSYMQVCVTYLMRATHIYLLPGWQKSRGANLELLIAMSLGITIVDSQLGVIEVKEPSFTFQTKLKVQTQSPVAQ